MLVEVASADIELWEEKESEDLGLDFLDNNIENNTPGSSMTFTPIIDLHIEVLDPNRKNLDPHIIIGFQLKRCAEFMEHAIKLCVPSITIIHGKGKGTLKAEVINFLQEFRSIYITRHTPRWGARMHHEL